MKDELDYFQILGIERDATPEEIRDAYFELARQYHPDANPDPETREHFLVIQEAYSTLSNKERRAEYEATLPSLPTASEISASILLSRNIVPLLSEPQLVYALLELSRVSNTEHLDQPPVHICLVIDRSTSMKGERIEMVKANITQFLKLLKPQDLVSVVSFSDRAEVVIPPSRATDLQRLEGRIGTITTGGGTEIYSGLESGLAQFSYARGLQMIKQLFLLTDGHTYGDEETSIELARKAASDGVTINAFGLGHEWNDAFLDRMTSISGGNTLFITSPNDMVHFLEQRLRSLSATYARQVRFQFHSTPKVDLRYAFRIEPDISPLQSISPFILGDLEAGKRLVVLMEFLLPRFTEELKEVSLADGRLMMNIPSRGDLEVRLPIKIECPVQINPNPELPPAVLVEAMSHLSLYRLQEKARQEVATGNITQATRHLQYLATNLLALGNRDLAHAVLVEAEHIQQSRQFSREGDKRIKYGTRALLLPSGLE